MGDLKKRLDLSPVSTTRVDGPSWQVTGFYYPCWRIMETGHPSTRAVISGRQLW